MPEATDWEVIMLEQAKKILEQGQKVEMVELVGSEKQVKYAKDLRRTYFPRIFTHLPSLIADYEEYQNDEDADEYAEDLQEAIDNFNVLTAETSAGKLINHMV